MSLAEINLAVAMIYGPIGCACAWVILRSDHKATAEAREVVSEIRTLSHKISGLMQAHLIATLADPHLDPKLRAFGEAMLAAEDRRQRDAS